MKRNIIIMAISVMIGFAGAWFLSAQIGREAYASEVQEGIAEEILRFHVRANSDSEEDQNLKLLVKGHVIEYMKDILEDAGDLEETKKAIHENMDDILAEAGNIIQEQGYSYEVRGAVKKIYFPAKTYGDCTFPAGTYEAFQIEIGKGKGKNWWCVLYPNLCFTDAVHGVVTEEGKQELEGVLTEEEYDEITNGGKVKLKLKFLDFFRE